MDFTQKEIDEMAKELRAIRKEQRWAKINAPITKEECLRAGWDDRKIASYINTFAIVQCGGNGPVTHFNSLKP